jgi:hypothetical protein
MFKELMRDQRPLMIAGFAYLVLFVILAVVSAFDSTLILGINRWIKPMKFASSIGIYLLTLAIYLRFINGRERAKKVITWGAIVTMTGEIILIVMQAARGTTSHFNSTTLFDSSVFTAMGLIIVTNTFFIVYLLILYFRAEIDLPRSIVWGMRLGIALFVLAAFEGGLMSAMMRHSVGIADGGPGLPFVNWSTRGGDLRAAHFIGLHAFQAVPIFALAVEKFKIRAAVSLTILFGVVYFAIFTAVFVGALLGRPLLPLN